MDRASDGTNPASAHDVTVAFVATTGDGVARAVRVDDGWSVERRLRGRDVRCLAADPAGSQTVYAGTQGGGVLRSADGGATWEAAGLAGTVVKSLAVSPRDADRVYAGTRPPLLYVTHDGGESWTELGGFRDVPWRRLWVSPAEPPFFRAYVQAIALSPTDPDVLLAGVEAGAVVRSTDGGETWSGHCRGAMRDCHSLAFHERDGDVAYQGGTGFRRRGAAVSRDAGETWDARNPGLSRGYGWACAADPERPDVRYVSAAPGVMRAHSDGKADAYVYRSVGDGPWEKLCGGLPQPLDHMPYALCTDGEPGHLYAGLANGRVWFSADRGKTWARLPFDLGAVERDLVLL